MNFPNLDSGRIRPTFIQGLARISLTLGLAHFLAVPILFLLDFQTQLPVIREYSGLLTLTGLLLLGLAALFRYESLWKQLPYLCFGALYCQMALFLYHEHSIYHPVAMVFPLLVSLAAPILGRRRAYVISLISFGLFLVYAWLFSRTGKYPFVVQAPQLAFLAICLLVAAYLSETLWSEILLKERQLREALGEISRRSYEMETWVHKLGEASSLIRSGNYSTELPEPLPYRVFHELTENVGQMQNTLRQYFSNVMLKDRLSSVGTLASGVAHELNTPLTTIQFILSASKDISPETREKIQNELTHLAEIARGLLNYAAQGGDEVFDLNQALKASEKLMLYTKAEKLTLKLDLCDGTIPIQGSRSQIQQVLMNLFRNACDALDKTAAPEITIRTTRDEHDRVSVEFCDNGEGISPDNLNKILDPFFTTKIGTGTGLGLYIVDQIVRAHNGSLAIESELGSGTSVHLTFPLAQADQKPKVREAA